MKRLILMRHAKAMVGEAGQPDRDRPLAARGVKDAKAMGQVFLDHPPLPDRILCSSARRTRETLAALLPVLDANFDVTVTDNLYEDAGSYLEVLQSFAGGANVVLIIGHNPLVHMTAMNLAGDGADDGRARMGAKYPTGALAFLEFRGGDWGHIAPASGSLSAFVTPSDIVGRRAG